MTVAHENNISLADGLYADIPDSARLDAKRLNRWKGKRWYWSGPFCLELKDRSELRQIERPNRFVEENVSFDDMETEKSPKECRKRSSNQLHCLPKLKKSTTGLT